MKSVIFDKHQVNYALENKEGVFREVVKPQPEEKTKGYFYLPNETTGYCESLFILDKSTYKVGQEIFVKEAFYEDSMFRQFKGYDELQNSIMINARHMKQEHSRLTLRVKDIRVERLEDISEEDCYKSGVKCLSGSEIADTGDYFESEFYFGELEERIMECGCNAAREACDKCCYYFGSDYTNTYNNPFDPFIDYWDSTHKKPEHKLDANPWVWVFSYEVININLKK